MLNKQYTLDEVKTVASDFLARKRARNETTFKNYRTSLNYFLYYVEDIAKASVIGNDNAGILLEGFQGSLFEGFTYAANGIKRPVKVKANGVNTHVRRINTFIKCLGFSVELNKLNVAKPKYKSLAVNEIELLINECSNKWPNEEIATRNATLIKFLFNTAFRINEALTLRTENIFSENGSYYVSIHEKGKAKGVLTEVAISEKTFNLLNDYINIKSVPSEFVFSTTRAGTDGKAKPLTRQNFNKYIIDLAEYTDNKHGTNISKTVENNSSHVFRHSKATYLLNVKKEDIITVKEILRHSSIDSTLIYLNPQEEAINKVRISNDI